MVWMVLEVFKKILGDEFGHERRGWRLVFILFIVFLKGLVLIIARTSLRRNNYRNLYTAVMYNRALCLSMKQDPVQKPTCKRKVHELR